MGNIENLIKEIVVDSSGMKESDFSSDSILFEVGINSIMFIQIFVLLEEKFNIELDISEMEISKINRLNDLVKIVEEKIQLSNKL